MQFQQFIIENFQTQKISLGNYQQQLDGYQNRFKDLQKINLELKGIELGYKNKLTRSKIFSSENQIILAIILIILHINPLILLQKKLSQVLNRNLQPILILIYRIIIACSDGKCRLWKVNNNNDTQYTDICITKDQLKLNKFMLCYDGIVSTGKEPSFFITDINEQKNLVENYQHSNMITTMSQHKEGCLVYFGEDSGYGVVWDYRILEPVTDFNTDFEEERKFFGTKDYEFTNIKYVHEDRINDSNFDNTGFLLVTCSSDKMVKVWDLRKQKLIQDIPAHNNMIIQSQFLNNQNFLMTADIKGEIKIWDWYNQKVIKQIEGNKKKIVSVQIFNNEQTIALTYLDKKIEIYDIF